MFYVYNLDAAGSQSLELLQRSQGTTLFEIFQEFLSRTPAALQNA
jgi:hypothetical protein